MIRSEDTGRLPDGHYEAEIASLDDVHAALLRDAVEAVTASTPRALAEDSADWRQAVSAYEEAVQWLMANKPGARQHARACAELLQQQIVAPR